MLLGGDFYAFLPPWWPAPFEWIRGGGIESNRKSKTSSRKKDKKARLLSKNRRDLDVNKLFFGKAATSVWYRWKGAFPIYVATYLQTEFRRHILHCKCVWLSLSFRKRKRERKEKKWNIKYTSFYPNAFLSNRSSSFHFRSLTVETTFLGFCDLSPYIAAEGRFWNPECCWSYSNQFSEQILLILWLFIGPGYSTTPFIPTLLDSPWPEEKKACSVNFETFLPLPISPSQCPLAAKQQSCFVVRESVGVVCCSLYTYIFVSRWCRHRLALGFGFLPWDRVPPPAAIHPPTKPTLPLFVCTTSSSSIRVNDARTSGAVGVVTFGDREFPVSLVLISGISRALGKFFPF